MLPQPVNHGPAATAARPRRARACGLMALVLLVLASCSQSSGPFKLEGRFRNMNQAEFYLYDAEQGWKDTIAVRDGRFAYSRTLTDTATLVLLFPNFSEMPVFARPGVKVKVKGDASHLRETELSGSKENEEMTAFRLRANQLTPPEVQQQARQFIAAEPASPVSFYLLKHYFLTSPAADYDLAYRLCDSILHATENGSVVRLHKQLATMRNGGVGTCLPQFAVKDTRGRTVTQKHLQAPVNVVLLWASWQAESRIMLSQLRRLQKEHKGQLAVLSVSLDATQAEGRYYLERDSVDWPNVCDGKLWQSALVGKFGFTTVPGVVVADAKGKIVARDLPTANKLKDELESLLAPPAAK